jgi:hypothetical protein
LSVFALAAFSFDTASAVSRIRYQQQVDLKCNGNDECTARFVHLSSSQALEIAHVWCDIAVNGTGNAPNIETAVVYSLPKTVPFFSVPLELGWDRTRDAGTYKMHLYTLRADPDMLVPFGGQFTANISYSPGDNIFVVGTCSFTGVVVTK